MAMDTYNPVKTRESAALGALGGAATGALGGAALGPVGAALGAVVGGISGGVTAGEQAKSEQVNALKAQRLAEQQKKDTSITAQQQALLAKPLNANAGPSDITTPNILKAAGGYDAWKARA
jgi:outer membrane lipoprotein SlyB